MKKLAVLISNAGTGTNLQAIIDAIKKRDLHAEIQIVISGSPDAYGLVRAKKNHIPTLILKPNDKGDTVLKNMNPDFIVLAGWKRIISDHLIEDFPNRILNIHPGLIPDSLDGTVKNPDGTASLWNKGKMTDVAINNFLISKSTYAGSSVHFLTHEFDFGPVLARTFEKIQKGDSVDTLYSRLKVKENKICVESLKKLCIKKNILIIGSGGREHALGWKIRQSPEVNSIYFAPGNGGTLEIGKNIDINIEKNIEIAEWAKENKIDLTIIGPEGPLVSGIVDLFQKKGLIVFGPNAAASQLEGSKAWAVKFMQKWKIPHPQSFVFSTAGEAKRFIQKSKWQGMVAKADGLAQGKGVIVCDTKSEAEKAIDEVMVKKTFGDAGKSAVIQEKLLGEEVSILAFCDGKTVVPLLSSQDHKRIYDDDKGPNTGGMGAYAPVPFVSSQLLAKITKTILQPTIYGLKKEGIEYKGVLYAGLMLTKQGPKVLEYNVRFGDPETQPLMMLLESDLFSIIESCIKGTLKKTDVTFKKGSAVCVVLTSEGYPSAYKKGQEILGLKPYDDKNLQVFHAGTELKDDKIITSGGRVLGVTGYASTLRKAVSKTYKEIGKNKIYFDHMQYRKDIANKALKISDREEGK